MITPLHIANQLENVERMDLMPVFRSAASKYSVPVTLLLAIASKETGMGTDPYLLSSNWTGRDGHGKGIMQVDDRYHSIMHVVPADDHITNIDYAAEFLAGLLRDLPNQHQAVAAYNAGAGGVRRVVNQGLSPDAATTGGNYGKDVLQRERIISNKMRLGLFRAGITEIIPALLLLSGGLGLLIQELNHK